jgi:cytidylate kinase
LDAELRSARVTSLVSKLARLESVRQTILSMLRTAGAAGRVVAEGRDMGTVVFPDAEVKVFLVADLDERARRRLRERGQDKPGQPEVAQEAHRIAARDRTDSEREHSPLRRAHDATGIDTTRLSFEEQVMLIVDLVRARAPTG